MKWNLYDDDIGEWGAVVIEQHLTKHSEKQASDSDLGHIKVDSDTILISPDGTIKVSDEIALNKFETIVYNIGSTIADGRVQETHFPFGFDCRLINIEISIIQPSNSTMEVNFERTTDYVNYQEMLNNDIEILANSNYQYHDVNVNNLLINKGDKVFVVFKNTIQDARNAVITMTVEKL